MPVDLFLRKQPAPPKEDLYLRIRSGPRPVLLKVSTGETKVTHKADKEAV